MATTWNSSKVGGDIDMATKSQAIDFGCMIHKRIMAEGGYMVHADDRSWFEKYDRTNGEFSRVFSPDLMELLRKHRSQIKVYAAWRRKSMSTPLAIGSSPDPQKARPNPQRTRIAGLQRAKDGLFMHGLSLAVPGTGGGVAADDGGIDARHGGFCVNFAPHGATGKREGGEL